MIFSDLSVFVYGTLKPGGHYWPKYCAGKVKSILPAQIQGELYDLHVGYPGLILRGDDWVQGYVLTFSQQADFAELDVLEGYEPGRSNEQNEYLRLRVQCYDAAGEPLGEVWAYEITDFSFKNYTATRIEDGNWYID
jgi:gamma-glutamylcyclotransferase (GGCT)/AIG2-like uncharacterized protein YtfP